MRVARLGLSGLTTFALVLGGAAFAAPANAHGYVNAPESRSIMCKLGKNTNCGAIVYEPQSLEYVKGFPAGGPADGQIASAGGQFGGNLDQQSATRWSKTAITAGPLRFDWTYTAPHNTSKWHYYMTKPGWDVNAPLNRGDLELIGEVTHDGSPANTNPYHTITVPSNRTGYHVILAVWDVSNTVNAFYNVIDVNVIGGPSDSMAPSTPANLHSMGATESSVNLMWNAATDNIAVAGYQVSRDGVVIGTTNKLVLTDSGLQPGSSYRYVVRAVDGAGNVSPASNTLNITTKSTAVVEPVMPATGTWSAVAAYIKGDRVTHNGSSYEAVQTHRGVGDPNWITAQSLWTKLGTAATIAPQPSPVPIPTASVWNSTGSYGAGDTVTFNGGIYRAVQPHTGVGDPNWIYAPSLWTKI
jgi:chitin-binding protein